ncbi:uridine kinase [Streptomyces sp. NPDC059256]|uniref:uridine kinase family protein n=1 Tax=Streptomyces sp. NPDC059256 TaxID=3346794 RepID=UPI0036A9A51F
MDDLQWLATGLHALAPSCGPVRLVSVDGHAGSGKSTFAARLAAALGTESEPAPVLHLDDLASHAEPFAWTDRMLAEVIAPLSEGRAAHYAPYDWDAHRFTAPRRLPLAPVVLIEGVGAGRRALRPRLAGLFWMDRDASSSWQRGRQRDGEALTEFWDGWTTAETQHFSADPSRPYAQALVQERPEGYAVLPGPDIPSELNRFITLSNRT